MRPPEEFTAISLGSRLPIDLELVRDIEEFDGPLLSEFRSADGETFLYYWCDCSETTNRWLVVRTPPQDLFRYLVGRSSLRSLIRDCRDGFLYVVDVDGDAAILAAWFAYADKLPESYLPGPGSCRQLGAGIDPHFQDVYVDQKWDYEQVAEYPRSYLQAYAFHTAFGQGGDPGTLSVHYRLTSGWIFHTLYERMRTNAPPQLRASLEAVAFASPGYLRFRVDPVIAEGVREAVARYLVHRPELREAADDLRYWTNGHRDLDEADASALIRQTAETVGVDGLALLRHIDTPENAGKALISYLGRLDFFAVNEVEHTAMLVGLPSGDTEPKL